MQTLITGTPGAGKTLLALEKLVLPMIGTSIRQRTDDGVEVDHPRTIYTNIKGLQVDHELCEPGATWEHTKDGWKQAAEGNRLGFHNWHEWAKPGAVIVVDEFQRIWPPRPNGAPVPPDVAAMDTHRHMGVDFVLITQTGNNVDRHILGLIGRHLHVRRIANMPLAIVYEWDHASRSLQFSKAIAKGPWRYDRRIFKLYHSSDLHTRQPRSVPSLLFVVALALAVGAWFLPAAYGRIAGKGDEHQARMSALAGDKAGQAQEQPAARAAPSPLFPAPAGPVPVGLAAPVSSAAPTLQPAGCIAVRERCECFTADGRRVEVELATCEAGLPIGGPVRDLAAFPAVRRSDLRPPVDPRDLDLAQFATRQRR